MGPQGSYLGSRPCIVVLHEVWGPDAHIGKVCKRLGKSGFSATAPSLYKGYESLLTPPNIRRAMDVVWSLSLEERRDKRKMAREVARKGAGSKTQEVLSVLYDREFRDGMLEIVIEAVRDAKARHERVATLGFSLGGGLSLVAATKPGRPDAAVAYCAEPPNPSAFRGIAIPTLVICASRDELMNPLMPAFMEAALAGGSDLLVKTIPNTQHDFFNEGMKERYNRAAAEDAWETVIWFLTRALVAKLPSQRNNSG
ncbi:MAG: dienelactone hydrolase family protein [Nitrososphaerota archaeon]|nr:dienelactone hydrolase family protein [Nitrososphaerota archaeon]MDG6964917.1 dienelactone hydrolase family protein [Nitrososphaerota archaeon]MDG6974270.1 dienelactone hydrolase family protein [Nitrososphaerota archaeon]